MMNEFNPDGKDIRFIDSHYRDLFRIVMRSAHGLMSSVFILPEERLPVLHRPDRSYPGRKPPSVSVSYWRMASMPPM